jgi:hypothetical protein
VQAAPGWIETTRFDVFRGGCLTTQLVAPPDQQAQVVADVRHILGFTTRQELAAILDQRSDGRLRLDPTAPR